MTEKISPQKLFHVSEDASIRLFKPRPSPTHYAQINGDVVFAVNESFLHNYFLPRDCPRIAYYKNGNTSEKDIADLFNGSSADFIMTVENAWHDRIESTDLYCYEFPSESFSLLDENAGYYISYEAVEPLNIRKIDDPIAELQSKNVELRMIPNLWELADRVKSSSLSFSMIRMRNALPPSSP